MLSSDVWCGLRVHRVWNAEGKNLWSVNNERNASSAALIDNAQRSK
jgi:hypothetical protein